MTNFHIRFHTRERHLTTEKVTISAGKSALTPRFARVGLLGVFEDDDVELLFKLPFTDAEEDEDNDEEDKSPSSSTTKSLIRLSLGEGDADNEADGCSFCCCCCCFCCSSETIGFVKSRGFALM